MEISTENDLQSIMEEDDTRSPMEKALKALRDGSISCRQASIKFKVCRTTLRNHSLGRSSKSVGGQPKFNPREDEILKDVMKQCRDIGLHGTRTKDIPVMEKMAIDRGVDKSKFTKYWLKNFIRRFPAHSLEFSNSDAEDDAKAVAEASTKMTDASISIAEINLPISIPSTSLAELQAEMSGREVVDELHNKGYLTFPESVWVIAESLVSLRGYFKKYYGKIDTPGSEKPLRVAICGNAAGSFLTPCILLLNNQQEPVVRDFSAFTALAKKQLAPLITAQKNVMFMDRAASELKRVPDFVVTCLETEKDVKLLPFPQLKVAQNWSVKCGSLLQKAWNKYLETAHVQSDMQPTEGNLYDVAEHTKKAWAKVSLKQILVTSCEKTGLYPYQPELFSKALETFGLVVGPPARPERAKVPHKKTRTKVRQLLFEMGLNKYQCNAIGRHVRKFINENLPEDQRRPDIIRRKRLTNAEKAAKADMDMVESEDV